MARGALPLVGGVCWGVTAGKASHNASNARGVTAGKMGRNSSNTNNQYQHYSHHPSRLHRHRHLQCIFMSPRSVELFIVRDVNHQNAKTNCSQYSGKHSKMLKQIADNTSLHRNMPPRVHHRISTLQLQHLYDKDHGEAERNKGSIMTTTNASLS